MNQSVRLSTVICFCHYHTVGGVCSCLYYSHSVYLAQETALSSVRILVQLLSVNRLPSACSYAGDVEINVEIKKYFCKAGVKGVQVREEITRDGRTSLFQCCSSFLSLVAAREAACDPGASDRQHTAGRSRHDVLHPQARECCSCQHLYSCQLCTSAAHLQLSAF